MHKHAGLRKRTISTATTVFYDNIRHFPPVINGKINMMEFLNSSSDLVSLVERLGTVFAPVRRDMQGNIDKIKKHYIYDLDSCLLELMLDELASGKDVAVEGVLWLNRAFMFFELTFQAIIACLQSNKFDVNMKDLFTVAYEGSVKKYHNWGTRKIFSIICKMSPTLPQILKSLDADVNDPRPFEIVLSNLNVTLHIVRRKIDDFFKENDLFQDSVSTSSSSSKSSAQPSRKASK